MKVKKFNNLWTMGVVLSGALLLLVYVAKTIDTTWFLGIAQSPAVLRVGNYISTHTWAYYAASGALSFFIYFFYCCACCKKLYLNAKELLIVAMAIILLFLAQRFIPKQYTAINMSMMIILPAVFCGKLGATAFCFTTTSLIQSITLEVRNLNTMIANYNFATMLILMIDYYIVLVLLYFLLNYRREEKK